jgi:hypothetical protein
VRGRDLGIEVELRQQGRVAAPDVIVVIFVIGRVGAPGPLALEFIPTSTRA